ncbi:MAG: hypothetical protein SOT08_02945 [Candidatus Borkfalkiaceae bacterium]|nr:hypothetical protein [Christensenellaceae bacterium]
MESKKTDLILFLGQSNMQGQTERLTENEVVSDAYEYKFLTDKLVPLKNPVGENIAVGYEKGIDLDLEKLDFWLNTHLTGASVDGNTNMVPEFCRAYIKETYCTVVAAHIAKGSTEISYWTPNSEGYCAIVKKHLPQLKKSVKKISDAYFVFGCRVKTMRSRRRKKTTILSVLRR